MNCLLFLNPFEPKIKLRVIGNLCISLPLLLLLPVISHAEDFVSLQVIDDGDPLTNEDGRANTNINNVPFKRNSLTTVGGYQFTSYYHTDGSLIVGRRSTDESNWDILKTSFTSFNINDAHNTSSIAIDGNGVLHMSWGLHGNNLLYTTSTASVLNDNSMQMIGASVGNSAAPNSMTGLYDAGVTYPEFYNLPDGDLLFTYRNGGSGNGDYRMRRYDAATSQWSELGAGASDIWLGRQAPGSTLPNVNAYPNELALDSQGNLHATWTWRTGGDTAMGESGFQTNHHINYARSPDNGASWSTVDGTLYTTPIYETNAEIAIDLPEGSSLINTTGMTVDKLDQPVLASWWAPNASIGDHRRQYMLAWYDNAQEAWRTSQISNRTIDGPAKTSEAVVRDLGRPIVAVDDDNRVIVAYRDNQDANGITIAYSESTERNDWHFLELTSADLGAYEPTFDLGRWQQDGVLSLLYHPNAVGQIGTPVSVLEWDAGAYFDDLAAPKLTLVVDRDTGATSIQNTTGELIDIDGYSIRSDSGSLNPSSWQSLQDQSVGTWQEANATALRLNELDPFGSLAVHESSIMTLGAPYSPSAASIGEAIGNEDLEFEYTTSDGAIRNGIVEYQGYNNFVLFVDPLTGEAVLANSSAFDVSIDGYTVTSDSGSLLPGDGDWNSLDDQGVGDHGWHEANVSDERLSELRLSGAALIEQGDAFSLGALYDVERGSTDLVLQFLLAGESTPLTGIVVYEALTSGLIGDYNDDGIVDAADYTVWRDNLHTDFEMPNDATPGHVTVDDYEVWKSNFGQAVGGGASSSNSAVPEPSAFMLAIFGILPLLNKWRVGAYKLEIHRLFSCQPGLPLSQSERCRWS